MYTTKTDLRTVTIPARTQHEGLYAVTVMLDWHCPACGQSRGDVFQTRSYDGSRTLDCEGWINDCGHTDKYEAVLQEAANNGLNTEPEAKQLEELSINYKNNWEQLMINTFLNSAQAEQNQDSDSFNQTGLNPDFGHRLAPLLNGINIWGVAETIDYTALRVCSLLSLLKCQFVESAGSPLDDESIYYSFATVSMDIKDIAAFLCAFRPVWKTDQHKSIPDGQKAFANIEQSLAKAMGVVYLLCNQFADEDSHSDRERICGAIDSIVQDIATIRLAVKDFHKAVQNHQA